MKLIKFQDENELLRPKVKLVGNMHGNEPTGRELIIHLAKYLLSAHRDGDERATKILKSMDLYILPTMNPDGFARGTEGRCSGGNYPAGRFSEGILMLTIITNELLIRIVPYFREIRPQQEFP